MVSEDKSNTEPSRIRTFVVDLQHLRYAMAAADHGSFRRAADALLLRQSTLSRCIRQLEDSVGMVVFERGAALGDPKSRHHSRPPQAHLDDRGLLWDEISRACPLRALA